MAQEKELCIQEMARRICERRKQLRLTQEELAEMSDMTTQAVSYAESGKRAMRPDSLRKLAAALCVSADYLLTGDIVDLYAVHLKPNCCVACFNCVRFTPSLPMCTTCPTSTISTSNP